MLVVIIVMVVLFGVEIISLRNIRNDDIGEDLQLKEIPIQDEWK